MRTNEMTTILGGVGLGAALMYVLDPERGKRRRARVRDKLVSASNKTADALGTTARDMRNRAHALDVSRLFGSDSETSDQKLVARVRSKLGRVVSHPHAINVTANEGHVTLNGPILTHEVDDLLKAVSKVSGVNEIENQLEEHKQPDISALQGGKPRPGDRFEFLQENWSPAARVVAGATGGALTVYGFGRRDPLHIVLGTLGAGLLLRGLTNTDLKRLTGICAGRRAIELQKDINVAAPIDQVYSFWSDVENFPQFMSHVREVRAANGQSHWRVEGPAGMQVEWDAVITKQIPNKLIAWKTIKGASVAHAGIVRFDENDDGTTRVEVKLSYNPPAGAVGHALATALGSDPKRQMDDDLMRMKTTLETGRPPHDAAG